MVNLYTLDLWIIYQMSSQVRLHMSKDAKSFLYVPLGDITQIKRNNCHSKTEFIPYFIFNSISQAYDT